MNINRYFKDKPIDEYTMPNAAFHHDIEAIKELHELKAPIDLILIMAEMFEGYCSCGCGGDLIINEKDVEVLRLLFKWEREEEKL